MNDTVIFLHLPRTGGTTLRDILAMQYSDLESFENKTLTDTDNNFNHENISEKSIYKLIKGHVYFGIHEYIPQKCIYFSMMRNPVERVLSVYNYVKKRTNHQDHDYVKEKSIIEYIESRRNLMLNNAQTRLLAGRETALNIPYKEMNDNHLEIAKQNIENHFLLVGLTERFDETLLLLQHLLKWKTPYYSIANAVKRKRKTSQLDSAIIDNIKRYNQLDLQLYDHVSALFNKQISNNPIVSDEFVKFELKNRFAGKLQIGARLKRKISKWTKK